MGTAGNFGNFLFLLPITTDKVFFIPYLTFMTITKTSIIDFFSKTKVIFATIAAIITFSITMYNQFKGSKTTEISGIVGLDNVNDPVDAVVRISSPISQATETDAKGHFKFKIDNCQTDTFLLVVQNNRTKTVTKQNEYVNASQGRKDIVVLFDSNMKNGGVYTTMDTSRHYRKAPNLKKLFQGLLH